MIRIGTVAWFIVMALLGVGLFQVKYAVQGKERELRAVNHRIALDREALRVLDAEWSYLNDPARLADLARRHTDLAPAMAGQLATLENLPPRPADLPVPAAPALPPVAGLAGDAQPAAAAALVPASSTPVASEPSPPASPATASPAAVQPAVSQPAVSKAAVSGSEPVAGPPAVDDPTISAILADMQANQGGDSDAGGTAAGASGAE